jgi:hypothetical protein
MEQNYDTLEIEILEQGQDYKLKFQGNLHNNNILYGNISDYMLDVYKDSLGELFVRDQRDSIWKKAGALELDSLRDLLVSPLGLLVEWSHLFKKARFVNYSEEGKKVVLLNISQQELQKAMHSNDFFMNPLSLECIVFIDPEKVFIEQIIFSFYDQKLEKNILCRTFFIKIPSKCYIPAQILPQSNIKAGIPAKNFS